MREATSNPEKTAVPAVRTRRNARRFPPAVATRDLIDGSLRNTIRRAFFAEGGETADRYGISLEQVLAHLEVADEFARLRSGTGSGHRVSRIPSMISDLVTATACSHGVGTAWQDIRDEHGHLLIRACEMRLGEIDAMLFVRRFWEDLESRTRGCDDSSGPRMQDYLATRPLRVWLADRLLGKLEYLSREGALPNHSTRSVCLGSRPALRLVE